MRTLRSGQFHGSFRDSIQVGGLTLAESEYAPGHALPEHAHEYPFFSLLVTGRYQERLGRRERTLLPTSLVFYPSLEPHSDSFGDEGGRAFNVELGGDWIHRMRAYGLDEPDGSEEIRRSGVNWTATRLYAWFRAGGNETGAETFVLEMLEQLTGFKEHVDAAPPRWLERVRNMLHEHYGEVLRVTALADEAGVHPVHLGRVFRRHHGCTIGEYIHRLRVEHACHALADKDDSICAIALRTGFSDQAHFTRRFKAVTGMSPGLYRRVISS